MAPPLGVARWIAAAITLSSLVSVAAADGNGAYPCMKKGHPAGPDQTICDAIKHPGPVGSKCTLQAGGAWFCGGNGAPCDADSQCAAKDASCWKPLGSKHGVCASVPAPIKEGKSCAGWSSVCEKPLLCNKDKICAHPPPPTDTHVKEGGSCAHNHQSCEKPLICNEKTKICMKDTPPPPATHVKEGGSCAHNHQSCEKPLICNEKTKVCVKAAPPTHMYVKEGASCARKNQRCTGDLVCHKKKKVCTRRPVAPKPSQKNHRRDINFAGRGAVCPETHQACPLPGLKTGFECVDTTTSLEQCGRCASAGGVDCTAIAGVEAVGCVAGRCEVWSCATDYTYNARSQTCEKA